MSHHSSSRLRALVQTITTLFVILSMFSPIVAAGAPSAPAVDDPLPAAEAVLSVALRSEPEIAAAGQSITLAATMSNEGDADLTGLSFDMALPEGLEYEESDAPNVEYDGDTRRVTWQAPGLGAGAHMAASVTAVAAAAGEYVVTLVASAEELTEPVLVQAIVRVIGEPAVDPTVDPTAEPTEEPPAEPTKEPPFEKLPLEAVEDDAGIEEQLAYLSVELTADPAEIEPGGVVAFVATLSNAGEAAIEKLSVDIELPAGVKLPVRESRRVRV